MYEIVENNWHIVPLDFVNFLELLEAYKQKLVFTSGFALTDEMALEINSLASENKDKYFALDMKNIDEISARLNEKLSESNRNIIFFNINQNNKVVIERLNAMYSGELFWPDPSTACFDSRYISIYRKLKESKIEQYHDHEQDRIVRSLVTPLDDPYKLDSSGLFCNCYVSIKSLFSNTIGFRYTIFNMASLLKGELSDVDAFITSSRNGAILASVLGGLLNIKEVHLIGIGPMYAARLGDSVDCIRKNKHYAYIFDFMCTGTEMKIVRALINSRKASLVKSVGIARVYKEGDDVYMSKNHIKVLTDTVRAGIDYRIGTTSKELTTSKSEELTT